MVNICGKNVAVHQIRSLAAQLLATLAPNLLLLDLGMAISFVTIALPALLNAPQGVSLDENQASWFGSIPFLAQPLGALVSGPIVDYFGRKKAAFLVNAPHIISWILMYYAWNIPSLFVATVLLGFGSGVMEAPISSYISEISEASIRGALLTVTQLFLAIGISLMYLLGALVSWRVAALICLCVPVITMLLAVTVAPDTPVWLLSQGKKEDALKSLCYIRGWTTPENVNEEFEQLLEYAKMIDSCVICSNMEKMETECEHNKINIIKRFFIKFRIIMFCKETMRPMVFSLLYFTFYIMSGLYPIKPNMENICGAMGMAEDPKTIVVMVGVLSLLSSIVLIGVIKYVGKRKIGVPVMLGSAICSTGLSIYAYTNLSSTVFSYDPTTFPKEKSVIPLIFLYGLTIFTSFNVSWILLGEVFPFRSRATSQGIAAAWNYIITFIGAKILINLETNFKLTGVFAVYAAFAYIGTIYLYLYIPETEGKTLQDIETFYKGKSRIFANDWFINMFRKKN